MVSTRRLMQALLNRSAIGDAAKSLRGKACKVRLRWRGKLRKRCMETGGTFTDNEQRSPEGMDQLVQDQSQARADATERSRRDRRTSATTCAAASAKDPHDEILEAIPLLLSPGDLLLSAMRVSRRWHAIIRRSHRLRQA
ncbi:hypothetical protein DOTSEDRAFT_75121, partial [Dothistroma septosporum NZE10]